MSQNALRLPETTQQRLEKFRQQVRIVKIAEGLLAGLFGLVVSYLVVFTIDRFIDTSAATRLTILLSGSIGIGVLFPWKKNGKSRRC